MAQSSGVSGWSGNPGPLFTGAVSSGSLSVGSYAVSNATYASALTLSDGSGQSVSMHPEGNVLILGDEGTIVRIPGRVEWTGGSCVVCATKPELGVLMQGAGTAILFCPPCAQKQLASTTVQDVLKQYQVIKKLEEAGNGVCPSVS